MQINETQLRMLVREALLRESSRETWHSEFLSIVNNALLGADILLLFAVPASGGTSLGVSKVLGIVGGVVNLAQAAEYMLDDPPQTYEAVWSVLTGIVSILSTPSLAKSVRLGARVLNITEIVMEAAQELEQAINRERPDEKEDTRQAVQRAVKAVNGGNLKPGAKWSDMFDLTMPIDDIAWDDAQAGVISSEEDVLDRVIYKFPKHADMLEQNSGIIYNFYRESRADHDASPAPRDGKKKIVGGKKTKAAGPVRQKSEIDDARYFRVDRDGVIYSYPMTGGPPTPTQYNVRKLKKGEKLPDGFTFDKTVVDNQGDILSVTIRGPNGNLLNVKSLTAP